MRGLILKDLFALKKQGKVLLVIFVFYLTYAIMQKNISMLGAMVAILCAMMPITTMSYDEYCKWDKYALSMPVSRKAIVLSKYILGIMLDLVAILLIAPISAVLAIYFDEMSVRESIMVVIAIGGVTIMLMSLILPILFKFGVEKGRMIMMLLIFLPTLIITMVPRLNIPIPSQQTIKYLSYASPVVIIMLVLLSIQVSIGIYGKKEF